MGSPTDDQRTTNNRERFDAIRENKTLAEVNPGNTVSLPNDPTNLARAIAILQQVGWVTLKPGTDPIRASERDIDANPHKLKLIQLEAAQLPRSLDDVDYACVNGNFALAAGLKLTTALALEKIPDYYMNLLAVKTPTSASRSSTTSRKPASRPSSSR